MTFSQANILGIKLKRIYKYCTYREVSIFLFLPEKPRIGLAPIRGFSYWQELQGMAPVFHVPDKDFKNITSLACTIPEIFGLQICSRNPPQ